MKSILSILLCFMTYCYFSAQENSSYFDEYITGNYVGNVSGIISIKKHPNNEIYSLQCISAELHIVEDTNQVYDLSIKSYEAKTMHNLGISYKTYASANSFGIILNNVVYELSCIDGASDVSLNGIKYSYLRTARIEYLTLYFEKDLALSNHQFLFRNDSTLTTDNYNLWKNKVKEIIVCSNSILIFSIYLPEK